jgi:hypothetical protein
LAWLERKNVIADDTLKPFHAIVARDTDLAAMRQIGESDCLANGTIFCFPVAIVGRDLPSGAVFEGGAELRVVLVKP